MAPHFSGASAAISEVFIPTATAATVKRQGKRRRDDVSISMVNTASDAAIAMNSIKFMDLLSNSKNSADIKTYTQSLMKPLIESHTSESNKEDDHSQPSNAGSSWGFSRWGFGGGANTSEDVTADESSSIDSSDHECLSESAKESKCTSYETVSEYIGRLWFLSDKKGIQFRETVRVLSVSTDGQSSTVECTSQYQKGSQWVDCSKVICKFSSVPLVSVSNGDQSGNEDKGARVKMSLDSELLVWLPLPQAASRAVGKKITSAFETAALEFFGELAL